MGWGLFKQKRFNSNRVFLRGSIFKLKKKKKRNFVVIIEVSKLLFSSFYSKIKYVYIIQSIPDNSNFQGKLKKVRVIGSSSYRGLNYIENDLKGKENWFELARGSS